MVNLPGKEIVEVLEGRLGKRLTTLLIWLIASAVAVAALGVIVSATRTSFAALRPFVPSGSWIDWAYRLAVLLLVGGSFGYLFWKLRRVETQSDLQERLNRLERVEADINKETWKQVEQLEERLKYIESKVGDKMLDTLVEIELSKKGVPISDIQRAIRVLPVPQPLSKKDEMRLAQAREILREAAATARQTEVAGTDLDKVTNQAWLHSQLLRMMAELFSFEVHVDFENFREGRERKMKQHGERPDGRSHFLAMADYFEKLANRLTLEDIDPQAKLPPSFADYLKGPELR